VVPPLYRSKGEGERARKAVAASALRRPAINGGSVQAAGRGRGREVVGECGGALKTEWRRRTGAGSRGGGTAARVAARPRGEEEGGRWRLKEHLTCVSHMSG
jgi:hypothetical protein